MTKLIIATFLLSASTSFAFEDRLECASLTMKYEKVRIHSGLRPRPGEKRSWSKLVVNGLSFDDSYVKLEDKKNTKKPKRTRTTLETNYHATLKAGPSRDAVRFTSRVLCKETKYIGPPPM